MASEKVDQAKTKLNDLLTKGECGALVKILMEAWGLSEELVFPERFQQLPTQQTAAVEEQTEFSLVLKAGGATKINVIKLVREVTGLGLKEAKDFVDAAPKAVKDGLGREEAESLKKRFEEVGALMELK